MAPWKEGTDRRRSQYPEEFRLRAAQLVIDSHRSIRDVVDEQGINHETLRNWVNAAKRQQAAGPAGLSGDERMELARGCDARSPSLPDLSRWTDEELHGVVATLNARPRKTLGWRTPAEVYQDQLTSLAQAGVASTP